MKLVGTELLVELIPLLGYAIIATLLTAGGLAAEYASLQHFGSGGLMVGLWLAALGAIMLYTGVYAIGYQKLLRRLVSA